MMRLRYRGVCESCGAHLTAGTTAVYDRARRKVRCSGCPVLVNPAQADADPPAEPDLDTANPFTSGPMTASGTAGGSALRIHEQLYTPDRARKEARVAEDRARRQRAKAERPILGRIVSAVTPKEQLGPVPQHITAWETGAEGEQRVGKRLDRWAAGGAGVVLHDRRKPGSRANIDHVAVTRSGVFVIDSKRYKGKVEAGSTGGWFSTDTRLRVSGRDQTKLTAGVSDQVAAVRSVLAYLWPDQARPAVQGMLCFVDADWAWLTKPFKVNDILVAWPAATVKILDRPGPWDPPRSLESVPPWPRSFVRPDRRPAGLDWRGSLVTRDDVCRESLPIRPAGAGGCHRRPEGEVTGDLLPRHRCRTSAAQ